MKKTARGLKERFFSSIHLYDEVEQEITRKNKENILIASALAAVVFLVMLVSSAFRPWLQTRLILYGSIEAASIIIFIVTKFFVKTNVIATRICMYALMMVLLGFGIFMGAVVDTSQVTVSFVVLLMTVPLIFTDKPIRVNILLFVAMIIYTIIAYINQNEVIFEYNMFDVYPYGFASMVITSLLMRSKIKKFGLEKENEYLMYHDQLTGLLNRLSLDERVEEIKNNPDCVPVGCYMFDADGLKKINDILGHHAGDELIVAAAECIKESFGRYCDCYRLGGDEFIALSRQEVPDYNVLKAEMDDLAENWEGKYIGGFSISAGFAVAMDLDEFENVMNKADEAMYKSKADFHGNNL